MFGRRKSTALEFPRLTASLLAEYKNDPIRFIEEQVVVLDSTTGSTSWTRPKLYGLQKQVIRDILTTRDGSGRRQYRKALLAHPRKYGKTGSVAAMIQYLVCTEPNHFIPLASPKKEQTRDLAFTMIADSFERNPALVRACGVVLEKDTIEVKATNSVIRNLACGPGGTAGYNWSVLFIDELSFWYGRILEEWHDTLCTPSPTRAETLILYASYGPIRGRSLLLQRLLAKAKNPPSDHYISWVHGKASVLSEQGPPWYSEAFLASVKGQVPPRVYKRVYLCEAVQESDESRYAFSRDAIQAITDPAWNSQLTRPADAMGHPVVGIDFAPKHDATALMVVGQHRDKSLRLWEGFAVHGSQKNPLNQDVVVNKVLDYLACYGPCRVIADPTGLTDAIRTLRTRGVEVTEINRQARNLGDILWRAVAGGRIKLFPHAAPAEFGDGRKITLQDELAHLKMDSEFRMSHEGEGRAVGRSFDDRCTALAEALLQFDLEAASVVQLNLSEWMAPQTGNVAMGVSGIGQRRLFAPGGVGTRECLAGVGESSLPRFSREWLSPEFQSGGRPANFSTFDFYGPFFQKG